MDVLIENARYRILISARSRTDKAKAAQTLAERPDIFSELLTFMHPLFTFALIAVLLTMSFESAKAFGEARPGETENLANLDRFMRPLTLLFTAAMVIWGSYLFGWQLAAASVAVGVMMGLGLQTYFSRNLGTVAVLSLISASMLAVYFHKSINYESVAISREVNQKCRDWGQQVGLSSDTWLESCRNTAFEQHNAGEPSIVTRSLDDYLALPISEQTKQRFWQTLSDDFRAWITDDVRAQCKSAKLLALVIFAQKETGSDRETVLEDLLDTAHLLSSDPDTSSLSVSKLRVAIRKGVQAAYDHPVDLVRLAELVTGTCIDLHSLLPLPSSVRESILADLVKVYD